MAPAKSVSGRAFDSAQDQPLQNPLESFERVPRKCAGHSKLCPSEFKFKSNGCLWGWFRPRSNLGA